MATTITGRKRNSVVAGLLPEPAGGLTPKISGGYGSGDAIAARLLRHLTMATQYVQLMNLYQALLQFSVAFNTIMTLSELRPTLLNAEHIALALGLPDATSVQDSAAYLGKQIATLHDTLISTTCNNPAGRGTGGGGGGGGDEEDKTMCPKPVIVDPDSVDCKSFADIIGQETAKQQMREGFIMPFLYPRLYGAMTRGVLLYGEPGTGKSDIIRAAVNELMSNEAIQVIVYAPTADALRGKYVGESEKKIADLFRCASERACACTFQPHVGDRIVFRARLHEIISVTADAVTLQRIEGGVNDGTPTTVTVPAADITTPQPEHMRRPGGMVYTPAVTVVSLIFLDEVDALALSRTEPDSNATTSITLLSLLQAMDGVATAPNVAVVAATNRPQKLDSAFMRRVPIRIHMTMPDVDDIALFLNTQITRHLTSKFTGTLPSQRITQHCVTAFANRQQGVNDSAGDNAGVTCGVRCKTRPPPNPLTWFTDYERLFPSFGVGDARTLAERMVGRSFSDLNQIAIRAFAIAATRALSDALFLSVPIEFPKGSNAVVYNLYLPSSTQQELLNGGTGIFDALANGTAYVAPEKVSGSEPGAIRIRDELFWSSKIIGGARNAFASVLRYVEPLLARLKTSSKFVDFFVSQESLETKSPSHYRILARMRGELVQTPRDAASAANYIPNDTALSKLYTARGFPALVTPTDAGRTLQTATVWYAERLFYLVQRTDYRLTPDTFAALPYASMIGALAGPDADNTKNTLAIEALDVLDLPNAVVNPIIYGIFQFDAGVLSRAGRMLFTPLLYQPVPTEVLSDWRTTPGSLWKLPGAAMEATLTQYSVGKLPPAENVFAYSPISHTLDRVSVEIYSLNQTIKEATYADSHSRRRFEREVREKVTNFDVKPQDFLDAMKLVPASVTQDEIDAIKTFAEKNK